MTLLKDLREKFFVFDHLIHGLAVSHFALINVGVVPQPSGDGHVILLLLQVLLLLPLSHGQHESGVVIIVLKGEI